MSKRAQPRQSSEKPRWRQSIQKTLGVEQKILELTERYGLKNEP